MASFFEKLKRGMGVEGIEEKAEEPEEKEMKEEKPARKKKVIRAKKIERERGRLTVEVKSPELRIEKVKPEEPEIRNEEVPKGKEEEKKEKWPEPEGQLAIDVYQTETELVIQSAIAGVKPEDLDISMERDIITIKGIRQKPIEENGDYFTQECYWGPFSREVILPVEIDPERAEAAMRDGILTIRIPKILREKKRVIRVRI